MLDFALHRIGAMLPTAFLVVALVVGLIDWVPGDPLAALLGEQALPADRAAMAAALGLDKPFSLRLWNYGVGLAHGDWGHSLMNGQPVLAMLVARAPATLALAGAAMAVAVGIGLSLGAGLAFAQNKFKIILQYFSLALMVTPSFVLGPLLVAVIAIELNLLPVAGMDGAKSLILPALTLGIGLGMVLARFVAERLQLLWAAESLRMACAKGAGVRRRFWYHALPQAAGPVLQILFLQLGMVLTGAVLTEAVFGWPGVGALLVESLHQRDYPVLQGVLLVIALTYMVCVLLSDVLAPLFDPRLYNKNNILT